MGSEGMNRGVALGPPGAASSPRLTADEHTDRTSAVVEISLLLLSTLRRNQAKGWADPAKFGLV
jgi:hypothetical protein